MAQPELQNAVRQVHGWLQLARLSDAELLDRFVRDRNEPAFALLMERHGRLVWSACRRILRHQQDAEDAYQAAFLVLVRRAASIRRGQTVACWLYRVASRIAWKLAMDRAKRRPREAQEPARTAASALQELAWRELESLLQEELARLPEKYQAPFVLCCLDGHSKSEAAQQLGWKEGTVSSRLAHARKQLQQRLARRGVTLASVLCGTEVFPKNPAVPAGLAQTTIRAAGCVLTGQTVAGLLSPGAVTLLEGALKTMVLSKIKVAITVTLAGCLIATGTAALAWQRQPESSVEPQTAFPFAYSGFDESKTASSRQPYGGKNVSNPWVGIASRETNSGPELFARFEDGTQRLYPVAADTVLLSYLPDQCLGAHESLSVDLADTNRILLRFDLPGGARVRQAELILWRSQSPHPSPSRPITLAFHKLEQGWDEGRTTWNSQPAFARRPALTASIDPAAREYHIDVTALVRRVVEDGIPNHGWLVRIDRPLATRSEGVGARPSGWTYRGEDYVFAVDDVVHHGGKQSCRIASKRPVRDFAMMSQTIRADDYRGQRIRLAGHFKTEALEGMATLWMRIDSQDGLLGIDKSVAEAVRGTSDWRAEHIVLDVPDDSKTIRFAVLVEGQGLAWVDDLRLEVVDRTVPLTNAPVKPASGRDHKPALPRQPVNLDFGGISQSP
jgi:RNA polymerase sigma factor (sigma-70 family)